MGPVAALSADVDDVVDDVVVVVVVVGDVVVGDGDVVVVGNVGDVGVVVVNVGVVVPLTLPSPCSHPPHILLSSSGESGLSHGIDVNPDTVRHSQLCCQRWYDSILQRRESGEAGLPTISREGVSFVEGNCFDIDVAASTACCR